MREVLNAPSLATKVLIMALLQNQHHGLTFKAVGTMEVKLECLWQNPK